MNRQERVKLAQKIITLFEEEGVFQENKTPNLDVCAVLDIVVTSLIGKQFTVELFLNKRQLKE